ncbi:MAG TPA: glycosyltransferase [Candidatus Angelobacter sp.]|jgi:spore maturation protein CgeB|nr:glycosyltransferase [Candidatus Angelobacter sp.]
MRIFAFGSSITSSYWNGAATYYRGIYKQIHALGHEITFAEPDAYGRQQKRDSGDFSYVNSVVYKTAEDIPTLLRQAAECDLVIKHSGVGVFDELLEEKVLQCQSENTKIAFWDVDAPATLARVEDNPADAFRRLIPQYDFILTYGGGAPVVEHYQRLGAVNCHPIYNALDPETHFPVSPDSAFTCDLLFVGHRLPDRERRVQEFFLRAAELAPDLQFALGGEGWEGKRMPANVRWIGHVGTGDHNRMNCSARMVLNINRDSMAGVGFSPPTRVFEAAGAAACLITDRWAGIETFFAPEKEILVASSAEEIVAYLRTITSVAAKEIGDNMRQRALRDHTYALRAQEFDAIMKSAVVEQLAN